MAATQVAQFRSINVIFSIRLKEPKSGEAFVASDER